MTSKINFNLGMTYMNIRLWDKAVRNFLLFSKLGYFSID